MQVIEKAYNEALKLAMDLINLYPIYNSDSQKEAQKVLGESFNFVRKPWEYDDYYDNYQFVMKHNLYAVLDSGIEGPTILLNGHLDVDIIDKNDKMKSFKKSSITEDGCLLGRGSTDMLFGLSSLSVVKNFLLDKDWKGKIIFTSVIDEEIGGNGSIRACQWLKEKGYLNDTSNTYCIIAEPTNNVKCNQSMGFLPFNISIRSDSVHMNAQSKANPIERFVSIINQINSIKKRYPGLSFNIGIMAGGEDPSLPISNLQLRGVIAMTPETTLDKIKSLMIGICEGCDIVFPNLQIEPYRSYDNSLKAYNNLFQSACDAPVFDRFQVPTIIWGPGSLSQAHTCDEFINLNECKAYIGDLYNFITVLLEDR
jgi:acetylornithine deacetylase/succinyl-diaminopimelate desuccinylase-like protein